MVGLNKIYKIYLLLFLLVSPFAFGQTTDINFDEIRVNGSLGPYEFCQGEVPNFQLRFRLTSGSTTLTLTSTNTLEITANGSGSNIFSKTVTNIFVLGDGGSIINDEVSDYYTWPIVGADAIQLSNAGSTDIQFKIVINSSIYNDPTETATSVTIITNANPSISTISSPQGTFNPAREISICDGTPITLFADGANSHFEYFRKPSGLAAFSSLGKSTSNSVTITDLSAGGEEIKVRAYNGDCLTDSFTYTINVSPTTSVILTDNLTNNTFCENDNVIFNAVGSGGWFQFLKVTGGVTSTVQSSTSATYSSTSLLDQDAILVRNFTTSATTCYSEKSIVVRLNSFSGTSTITGNQNICANSVPTILANDSQTTADRSTDGATTSYNWEKNEGAGWLSVGASNSINYQPPTLISTTAYRRVLQSEFNGKNCFSYSNVVTVTVNSLPEANLSGSGLTSSTICFGDKVP